MPRIKITLSKTKETKNTAVYEEIHAEDSDGEEVGTVFPVVYVQKTTLMYVSELGLIPGNITITLEA